MATTNLLPNTILSTGGGNSNNTEAIRVLLVDDHHVVREGLRRILELENRIQVVGDAGTG